MQVVLRRKSTMLIVLPEHIRNVVAATQARPVTIWTMKSVSDRVLNCRLPAQRSTLLLAAALTGERQKYVQKSQLSLDPLVMNQDIYLSLKYTKDANILALKIDERKNSGAKAKTSSYGVLILL